MSCDPTLAGLKVDYSPQDLKKGKVIHVADQIYQKGCILDVQHGMQVSIVVDIQVGGA